MMSVKSSEFGEKIVDDSNTSIDIQWALECSQHSRTLWSICFKSLIRLPNQADRHPPSYAESKVSYKFSVFLDFQAKLESSTWTSLTSTRFQHGWLRNPGHFMLFCFIARLALVGFLPHSDDWIAQIPGRSPFFSLCYFPDAKIAETYWNSQFLAKFHWWNFSFDHSTSTTFGESPCSSLGAPGWSKTRKQLITTGRVKSHLDLLKF